MDEDACGVGGEFPTLLRIGATGANQRARREDALTAPPETSASVSRMSGGLSIIRDSRLTRVHSETTDDN